MNQIKLHNEIDILLSHSPYEIDKSKVINLISQNIDGYKYFFHTADERWLDFLWHYGFLDSIKQHPKQLNEYRDNSPEFYYLIRAARKKPKEVADIILEVPISKENFAQSSIEYIMRICEILPSDQLKRIIPKIYKEKWIILLKTYSYWGFGFDKIFHTLVAAEDNNSVLLLAKILLCVKSKREYQNDKKNNFAGGPFYFNDIVGINVFEYLRDLNVKYSEKALKLLSLVLKKITLCGEKTDEDEIFPLRDIEPLYNIDLFNMTKKERVLHSSEEVIQEIVSYIIELTVKIFKQYKDDREKLRSIYESNVQSLPDSILTWRIRLFILSQAPDLFIEELEMSFQRLFAVMKEGKSYLDISDGTEYKKALKRCFEFLDEKYKRKYISSVLHYFSVPQEDKVLEKYRKNHGWEILSSIAKHLTPTEHSECEIRLGRKCDPSYNPEPSIPEIKVGVVSPRGPVEKNVFPSMSIEDIAQKLRSEWSPAALRRQNKPDELFNPINAEGTGEQLIKDMTDRFQEYINKAALFFERDVLDQHYTYSFFRGVHEYLRSIKDAPPAIDWSGLFVLMQAIRKTGETDRFSLESRDRDFIDVWLSNWTVVHSSIADVIYELLKEKDGGISLDFSAFRGQLFELIAYLLNHADPSLADEEPTTAKMRIQSGGNEVNLAVDPFTNAINSVRGKTFEALVLFLYQDTKGATTDEKNIVAEDIKNLYERVLKNEKTRAIMFMFGHYLPSFYFRDKKWTISLLPRIFPSETEKKYIFIAAWEGFLENPVYEELFFTEEIQDFYERGMHFIKNDDPGRKYSVELPEGTAIHFALAFIAFHGKFGIEDPLFKKFWYSSGNNKKQAKFIETIGRHFINSDNPRDNQVIKDDATSKERLKQLWDWVLEHFTEKEIFLEFGLWINTKKNIFENDWLAERIKKTLQITGGVLDWINGLFECIMELSGNVPEITLEIARLYLLEGVVRQQKSRMMFGFPDDAWIQSLKVLYENPSTRQGTIDLINDLISFGGSMFWGLKGILGKT